MVGTKTNAVMKSSNYLAFLLNVFIHPIWLIEDRMN